MLSSILNLSVNDILGLRPHIICQYKVAVSVPFNSMANLACLENGFQSAFSCSSGLLPVRPMICFFQNAEEGDWLGCPDSTLAGLPHPFSRHLRLRVVVGQSSNPQ